MLREGPSGVVYVPAIYPQINGNSNSEALIVGRETEWIESSSGIIRGQGLRSFIIGEQSLSIHELSNLQFE
jgi:type VI secretion system protein ImpE